jgi:hypothetical protein
MNGKKGRREDETHNLPSEMQRALDRILEEDREVFEALARA